MYKFYRMAGNTVQGSNDQSTWITLCAILAEPPKQEFTVTTGFFDEETGKVYPNKPAQPSGDDAAAIDALYYSMRDNGSGGEYVENKYMWEFARGILAAIRAGKVPGIRAWTFDQLTLETERDMLRGSAELLGQEVRGLRDKRDRLAAQVAGLTRERDEWKANHDNAVAIKRAVLDRPDLGSQSRRVLDLVAERDKALADLAAERERAEKAEGELFAEKCTRDAHIEAAIWETTAKLNAARAEAEAAKAELHVTKLSVAEWHADAERLSAELAEMKARKVKLPLMYGEANKGDPPDTAHGWRMYDDAIEACADAIRAAGVEVES